jgi:hypothetical protein
MLLYEYWGAFGYSRPVIDVYAVEPTGRAVPVAAQIDSAADFVVFEDWVGQRLRLQSPFARACQVSGAGGATVTQFTLPPDGTVSLFLTDYSEWCFLPAPPVGFWPAAPKGQRRSVLGATGFLQFFEVRLHNELPHPEVELIEAPGFAGLHGTLPPKTNLADFIRQLKVGP